MLSDAQRQYLTRVLANIDIDNPLDNNKWGWAIQGYETSIQYLADYFSHTQSSSILDTWIIKTAYLLFRLHENFKPTEYHPALRDNIKISLSIAQTLVRDIKRGGRRGQAFDYDITTLGEKLSDFYKAIQIAKHK